MAREIATGAGALLSRFCAGTDCGQDHGICLSVDRHGAFGFRRDFHAGQRTVCICLSEPRRKGWYGRERIFNRDKDNAIYFWTGCLGNDYLLPSGEETQVIILNVRN